jgi:hypothetical protein
MDHPPNVAPQQDGLTNLWLLVTLLLSLLVLPLLEGSYAGRVLFLVGLTFAFIVGAKATHSRMPIVTVLLVVGLPSAWATLFVTSTPIFVAHCLLGSTFFWLVGGVIVFVVVTTRTVTHDSIFGAICAFLAFGLAWALAYWAIYAILPEAFKFPGAEATGVGDELPPASEFSQAIYYSFVTMTTLGYGDITPVHRIARTLSWLQSVVGQFYVAVVIAWLVSALPRPGTDTK